MGKYDDMIGMEWPRERNSNRLHMSIQDRAKIFAPFAALRGYEEAIEAKKRIVVNKIELSDDMKEELDLKLKILNKKLLEGEHPLISLVHYERDWETGEGAYLLLKGMVARLDLSSKVIRIVNESISLDDVYELEGKLFDALED